MGSYGIRTLYPASGLGADSIVDPRFRNLMVVSPEQRIASQLKTNGGIAMAVGEASNLALIAAVGGVGLLAYLAAKALKK